MALDIYNGDIVDGSGTGLTGVPGSGGSLTPFKINTSVAHTGTLVETIITSVLIPANTFQANDWLRWTASINTSNNANAKTFKAYFNTSVSLVGATQVALRNLSAAISHPIIRNMFFQNSITSQRTMSGVALNTLSDETLVGTAANLAINFGVDQYFIISGQLGVISDTITVNGFTSQIMR